MHAQTVPQCGESNQRNLEYLNNYTPKQFFSHLIDTETPVVFDIGAHQGESIRFFKEIYPQAQIHSFEPHPDNFQICKAVADRFACHAYHLGVSEKKGWMTFYKQSISHLGGFLPINYDSQDSLGYAAQATNEAIEVEVTSIDHFCQENAIQAIDILKIDVQGYEIGVLQGARQMLKQTRCCSVEVGLFDFYTGSSSLLQVETLMRAAGLVLWDVAKISKNPKNLRTDWMELVYRRSPITS